MKVSPNQNLHPNMSPSKVFFYFSLYIYFSLYFFSLSINAATSEANCFNSPLCGKDEPIIKFPFRLVGHGQGESCGYPGFDLSCTSRGITVLDLPSSEEFLVRDIDYINQVIQIYDRDNCMPRRLLNLNLSGSPFDLVYFQTFTFINCSSEVDFSLLPRFIPIPCLRSSNYTVLATTNTGFVRSLVPRCELIKKISVPIPNFDYGFNFNLVADLRLSWGVPFCGDCAAQGGKCGFKNSTNGEIWCFNNPQRRGLSRPLRYVISIGLGIPALVGIIGLACYVCNRVKAYGGGGGVGGGRDQSHAEFSSAVTPQPVVVMVGLDQPTIESYPKTVLGQSRRLPDPDENSCPICLSEYQPKEELRTIPDCKHSFHANCIDEWLRMNATCPLCRNSPMPLPPPPVNAT